jgi:uncharacterized delta-60 repeat protein
MKQILTLTIFLVALQVNAQVTQEWVARYNGPGNSDQASAIAVDNEGNVYVTGQSYGGGSSDNDYATIKYNSSGDTLWVQRYNGPANSWDEAKAIAVDNEGNVYVTGSSRGVETDYDYATIKYDSLGVEQWVRRYNGPANLGDLATAIAVDNEGSVFVTGYSRGVETRHDYATIKYSSLGVEQWVRRYNGPADSSDAARAIAVDNEGNVYVTGSSAGDGTGGDYATIKYSSLGVEQWVQRYNGPANSSDRANAIAVDNEGNVYVTGYSVGDGTGNDYATIKYSSLGVEQWVQRYNGPSNNSDGATAIAVDNEGNVYVTGSSRGDGTDSDYATIKYSSLGVEQWVQRYNGPGNGQDIANAIAVDNEGSVFVTGYSRGSEPNYDYATIKYDSLGVEQWVQRYNGPANNSDIARAIAVDNEGNVYVTGVSGGDGTGSDYATIKYTAKKYPVFIVPGIAGTYASSTIADIGWILERGVNPLDLQIDPIGRVYNDLITTLENNGYESGKNLFVVNYDWRLTPGPIDNIIDGHIDGLSGTSIANNQFNYGVDYLGWYMKQSADYWRSEYDEELEYIDVIAHSTGGLVTRTYIQSNAYGDIYDAANNYKLPKIRNFLMIGVPNRGASKAWNAIHDNWIADIAYRFVLSKIINRAYQKVVIFGDVITGPDYDITLASIQDSLGNPDKQLFISKYVPTIRYLLATYDFINFGSGLTNVNNDPEIRNTIVLDLNNGFDINPLNDPNGFLDSAEVTVIYGTGESTSSQVQQRTDFEFNALHSFTDWAPRSALPGTLWFKDISINNNGDGTVPTVSSASQFLIDNRANLYAFSSGNHTELVSMVQVQNTILDLLNVSFAAGSISTGSGVNVTNVLHVINDPVDLILTDGNGNRFGYTNSTGVLNEIPNSIWFGDTDGMGYIFDIVQEPINLQLTGLGEEYYVMVSVADSLNYGGVVLEGFLAEGEVINYQITLDPLSVDEIKTLLPISFSLAQNFPNPFNPSTTISWQTPVGSHQTLKIYDILGREVATLVDEFREAGRYEVEFQSAVGNRQLSSGIYYYRLQAGSFVETKKMLLIK